MKRDDRPVKRLGGLLVRMLAEAPNGMNLENILRAVGILPRSKEALSIRAALDLNVDTGLLSRNTYGTYVLSGKGRGVAGIESAESGKVSSPKRRRRPSKGEHRLHAIARKRRTAVVSVLREAGGPLRVREVIRRLPERIRPSEPNTAYVLLHDMEFHRLISRPKQGWYCHPSLLEKSYADLDRGPDGKPFKSRKRHEVRRDFVVETIRSADGPIEIADLFGAVRDEGFRVSDASLHKDLSVLREKRLVERVRRGRYCAK